MEGNIYEDVHIEFEPDYFLSRAAESPTQSCLLLQELESLESAGMTELQIGGCVPSQIDRTNMVFYGQWRHGALQLEESHEPQSTASCAL